MFFPRTPPKEPHHSPLIEGKTRKALAYLAALLSVPLAYYIREDVHYLAGGAPPTYITFYPAVMLVALIGGLGPGLLTTALSVLTTLCFVLPPDSLLLPHHHSDAISMVMFGGTNLFFCFIAERYRQMRFRMEDLVKQRTAELETSRQLALASLEETAQAREALREREQQLRFFVEYSPAAIAMLDREMRYLVTSRRWLTDYRIACADIIGRSHYEVFPDIPERWKDIHCRCLAGAVEKCERDPFPHPDGSSDWVRWEIRPWHTVQGEIGGLLIFSEIITERIEAELKLQQEEQTLRGVLNATMESVWLFDPNGTVLMANETAARRVHQTPAEIVGKRFHDFSGAALADTRQARLQEAVETKCPVEFEDQRGGILFHHTFCPILDTSGNVLSVTSFSRDITKEKQAEETLRQTNERLKKVLEVETVGVMFWEMPSGVLRDANDTFLRLMGYSRRDIEARELTWQKLTPPEFLEVSRSELKKFERTGRVGPYEKQYLRKDGTRLWMLFVGSAIDSDSIVEFGVDISAQKNIEAALRESETKHRTLLESSRDAILTVDPTSSRFTSGNPAALKMFGAETEADLTAHGPADFSPGRQPDGRLSSERAREIIAAVMQTGTQFFEWQHRRLNGDDFFTDVLLTRIEWDGKPAIMATIRETTERKLAESALRQSEENSRAMFEMASIGMAQADPQTGRWLRVNRKFCEITGYTEAELLRKNVPEITHPDDRPHDWAMFQSVISGERPSYRVEKRYIRKNGTEAWVNVNMTVIRDASGRPSRTMATIEDITARKQTEMELVRLATAIEQSAESIVITDPHGTILYVNPAFETGSGYSRAEAVGKNPSLLKSGKQDTAFYRNLWKTLTRGEVWHGHFVNKRKDGTLFEEDATISPVRDASGTIVNFVALKIDVTREMELAAQFRQSQKMEAIGQLAGGVAHDFNNILAAVMMQTELTARLQGLPKEAREGLEHIRLSAERAAALTHQLLLFSRKQVMQSRALDLNGTVTNLATILQRVIGENMHLELHLHPAALMTQADPGMLDQILLNLAVNARDAMPEGGRLLIETGKAEAGSEALQPPPDAASGPYVWLRVSDTGCGMTPEVKARIFEPFFTTKETGKGTGLGLATVFGVVKQHRGWITVESEPGQGSSFQVYLPASTATGESNTAVPKARGGKETLLLTEDDSPLRIVTRKLLEQNGYTVLEAANGVEALDVWQRESGSVALLLTDLVMPEGISGHQLAHRLQAEKPTLKVIYTSGYSAEIAGHELRLKEGENFVQKPFSPELLLNTIRRSLD